MFAEGSGCFAEPSEGLRRVLETFGKVLQSLQKCPQVSGNSAEGLGEFWKVSRVSCNVFGMRLKLSAASRNHVREREKVLFRVSTCDNESETAKARVGKHGEISLRTRRAMMPQYTHEREKLTMLSAKPSAACKTFFPLNVLSCLGFVCAFLLFPFHHGFHELLCFASSYHRRAIKMQGFDMKRALR